MATLMKFEKGASTLQFLAGGSYPAQRQHELLQVQDRTAGGAMQVETLGISLQRRIITFNLMHKTDYDALINWFLNVVNGGELTFDFTDEYGDTGEVRILTSVLDFAETSLERYSGSITVEYV